MGSNATGRGIAIVVAALALAGVARVEGQTSAAGRADRSVDPATRAELLAARDAIWRAWFGNDTVQLERMLPEAAAAGAGRAWKDRRAILEGAKRFAAGGGKLVNIDFSDTEISLFGDVAVVRSVYRYEVETGGQRSASTGRATEVFVRRDGRWLNPLWHLGEG